MYPKHSETLIVTFGNSIENPGAATFAEEMFLKSKKDTFFFGTFSLNKPSKFLAYTNCTFLKLPAKVRKSRIRKVSNRYLHPAIFLSIARFVNKKKFRTIHFHSFGEEIPLLLLPYLKLRGFEVVVTHHDFMFIHNRKLYPEDIGTTEKKILEINYFKIRKLKKLLIVRFNKLIYKFIDTNIMISEMQASVFTALGYRVDKIIENKVPACTCSKTLGRESEIILFVGRSIGKGLIDLCTWMKNNNYKLWLVGEVEIFNIAKQFIQEERITFFGKLPSADVYKLMHSASVLAAKSECLDVFPTTVLEAIAHGLPVITSPSAGNSYLVRRISNKLVVNDFAELSKEELDFEIVKWYSHSALKQIRNYVSINN
jgi:glycosyltransferase involved in cell wall biosynthesis